MPPTLTLPARLPNGVTHDAILWDVAEEHLAEAAFGLEQFDSALQHPSLTLPDLARHPEGRLLAHLDALVIGGPDVRERLLLPALQEPDEDDPARVTAAAIPLINQGRHENIWPALTHEDSRIRDAAVRAASLCESADLDRWVTTRLAFASSPASIAGVLGLIAARGLGVSVLQKWLRSDDPGILVAAVHAARWADPGIHRAPVEDLIEHADPRVREQAVVSGLFLGSGRAWLACQRWALGEAAPPCLILALSAALGGRESIVQLARRLDDEDTRASTLFALAFCGDPARVPRLIELLRSKSALEAKLALQAIAAITGLDLRDDAYALDTATSSNEAAASDDEGSAEALPPLDDDDLDANLVPKPEDALPQPNAEAVENFWRRHESRFDLSRRYLAGSVFSTEALVRQIEYAPLRLRHVLALSLSVRAGSSAWIDTRAWSRTQRARIDVVRNGVVAGGHCSASE